jgi:hypothetical protein
LRGEILGFGLGEATDLNDPNMLQGYSLSKPNLGAGIYAYHKKAYIGLSIPHRHDWRCSQSKLGEMMDKGIVPRGSSGLDRLIELSDYPTPRTEEHDALEDCHATLHGIRWMLEKEKGAENTLRQLYVNILTERRRLEALLIRVGEWMDSKSSWDECGEIARLLSEEATRLKREEAPSHG